MTDPKTAVVFSKFFKTPDEAGDKDFALKMEDKVLALRDGVQEEEALPWAELAAEERALVVVLKIPRRFKDLQAAAVVAREKTVALVRGLHAAELLDTVSSDKARHLVPVEVRKAIAAAKGQQLVRKKLVPNVYRPNLEPESAGQNIEGAVVENVTAGAPEPPAAAPAPASWPKDQPPLPSNEPDRVSSAEIRKVRKEVDDLHPKLGTLDHFQVLGVQRTDGDDKVKAAYLQLVKKWHPDSIAGFPAKELETLKPKVEAIFAAVNEANQVLAEKKSREDYLTDLQRREMLGADAKNKAPARAEEAASHAQKGKVYMKQKEYARAEREYARAMELDGGIAEYHVERAWALSQDPARPAAQRRRDAIGMLRDLCKKSKYADAHFRLGLLLRAGGETKEAEECIRKAHALDPKHADAATEARIFDMRAKNEAAQKAVAKK